MNKVLNIVCFFLIAIVVTGCKQSGINTSAYYFKNVEGISVDKISVGSAHNNFFNLYEDDNDIYALNKSDYSSDLTALSPTSKNDSSSWGDIGRAYYNPSGVVKNKASGKKLLNIKRIDETSFLGISQKHTTLLYISADCYANKLYYSKKEGFAPYSDTLCKEYFDYSIEKIDYSKIIPKIKQAISTQNYMSIYNLKDSYIKYFIKKYLISELHKIEDKTQLKGYAPILKNLSIPDWETLILFQEDKIDIVKEFKSIKTKKDKQRFLKRENTIYVVTDKKLSIRDEPTYKKSEVLGYYKKGALVKAEKTTKKWILTQKGWIHKSYIKAQDKELKKYKKLARGLRL